MSDNAPRTILLVEDNPDDVFLMKRVFKKAGVENPLQVASDGRQALNYLAGTGEYHNRVLYPIPRLVFLDLKLPYVHGFEVLTWIRQQPALDSLPVVVLTSSAEERDMDRAKSFHVPYWVKPPTPEALKELLATLPLK